jgi:hypothetical protein
MSGTKNTKAATTAAAGEAKAKRVIGPRDVYLLFAEGTDPEFVKQVQASIASITMNGRALLKHLQGGAAKPFLSYKVHVEAREGKAGE